MSDDPSARPLRRALTAALGLQVLLALLLFAGDLGRDFSLPTRGPAAPDLDQPTTPGDQTRRYDPATRPAGPGVAPSGPMPERLVLTESDGAWSLSGQIAPGDGERIIRQIEARGDGAPQVIRLDSPGGSVTDALELGRTIREAGLSTDMESGAICLSACPYVLAAGTERSADEDARIGVHQHYFGENTLLPAFTAVSDIQRGQGLVMRYLDEMGIDLRLMEPALMTPPKEIYLLTREELRDFNLLTTAE